MACAYPEGKASMPFWHLLPLDVASDHWRASTYKGDVIVRATSEAEARSTATTTFFRAYERVPGGIILFSPGSQEQRPENVRLGNTERLLAIHFVVKTVA